jgi:hypothetical protein
LDSAFAKNNAEVDLKDEIVKYVQLIETSYSQVIQQLKG